MYMYIVVFTVDNLNQKYSQQLNESLFITLLSSFIMTQKSVIIFKIEIQNNDGS